MKYLYFYHGIKSKSSPNRATRFIFMISGFRRQVDKNCALLGSYAASSGNFLPTFRDNLSVPSSEVRNLRFTLCIPHFIPTLINAVADFQTAFQTRAT